MKKFLLLSACVIAALAVACSGDENAEAKKDSAAACKPINPNGDSELAILMREMAAWTDTNRVHFQSHGQLTAGELNAPDFNRLLTAKRTDPNIDTSVFNPLARLYLDQVQQFRNAGSDPATQAKYHNSMVKACVSCHENFCGGPIKRINKLFVTEK